MCSSDLPKKDRASCLIIGSDCDSAAFPTKVIDYLKLDIFNHEDNTAEDTIFLYLPETLSEAYTAKWEGVELGAAGAAAMNAARGIVDEKGIGEGFSEQLKKFAESAKPGLGFKAAAGAIEGVVGLTGAAGGGGGTCTTFKNYNGRDPDQ